MISLINSPDNTTNYTAAITRLVRAIIMSDGEFSLVLASCNVKREQQIVNCLEEFSSADIREILIPPSAKTLYTPLINAIGTTPPEALIVRGLESVVEINQLIISTNLMRDEFRKQFPFPVVLWVNDEIVRKLVWLAPDLKDWAGSTIRFDVPNHQFVKQTALSA
ncbi:MAG: hypothetical protein ACR2LR_00790 [Hassallia sp.]